MGYYSQAHSDDQSDDFDVSDSGFDETSHDSDTEIQAAEEYLLEQESLKAKKRDRAILKIRHAIEDYQERKKLKDEFDYLSSDSKDVG